MTNYNEILYIIGYTFLMLQIIFHVPGLDFWGEFAGNIHKTFVLETKQINYT